MTAQLFATLAAAVPLIVLGLLVLRSGVPLGVSAWGIAGVAAVLALTVFSLPPEWLLLAVAKGAWTGIWILLLVIPALLLFQVAESSTALARLTDELGSTAPTPARRLLLLGWVFPSFLQGVAGFGTPVVMAAPMLARSGVPPVAAVAAVLVGYHWSVTFGSMGSSFFVAAATAQLTGAELAAFAVRSALLLAVHGLAAGLLLLRRVPGSWTGVLPQALTIAAVMGVTLVATVAVQPALGSTAAGLAGLCAAFVLLPTDESSHAWRPLLLAAAPYLLLTGLVVVAFGVPVVRDIVEQVPAVAPSFPRTEAAFGHVNPAVDALQPFRPLLHAGVYLVIAAGFAALLYRRVGWWPAGTGAAIRTSWRTRSATVATSLLGLTVLASVMVDAGMIEVLAQALSAALGVVYIAVAPAVGALGTILTGSTTASNALLAPLQAAAAVRLDVAETALLAGQTVGGNVGNAWTPINAVVAAAAAGAAGQEGAILRSAAPDVALLLLLAVVGTIALALFG